MLCPFPRLLGKAGMGVLSAVDPVDRSGPGPCLTLLFRARDFFARPPPHPHPQPQPQPSPAGGGGVVRESCDFTEVLLSTGRNSFTSLSCIDYERKRDTSDANPPYIIRLGSKGI